MGNITMASTSRNASHDLSYSNLPDVPPNVHVDGRLPLLMWKRSALPCSWRGLNWQSGQHSCTGMNDLGDGINGR